MRLSLRHALISLAIVAMAFLSHGRVLSSGWLGPDLALLESAQGVGYAHGVYGDRGEPAAWHARDLWLDRTAARPVPTVALLAEVHFAGVATPSRPDEAMRPFGLRVLALTLLLATSSAAGFALRRALLPWIGGDTARAAGFALALFFATHPLGTAAIARPRALGELFALSFGALACWTFLRGRQEREKWVVAAAGVCAVLAGFSSPVAVLLPFVLFGLELGSTRRVRSLPERLRTAATTFLVFAGCVWVEAACAALVRAPGRTGFEGAVPALLAGHSIWSVAANVVEKLGILFLPVAGRPGSSSWPHYLVSVALVLVAILPVLRGARSAPRLWGWLALAWSAAMLLALLPGAHVRVEPTDYTNADLLLAASLFACTGLAVAATAQLGTRRILLPAVIALGFAWLGSRAAGGFVRAGAEVAELRADLAAAQRLGGDAAQVLVVDPPDRAGGLALELESLGSLAPSADSSPIAVPRAALSMLTRTARFASWREHGVVLLEPTGAGGQGSARRARLIPRSAGDPPPIEWRADVRSPWFERDLDPAKTNVAIVVPQPGASTAEAPTLSWRTGETSGESAEKQPTTTGVWLAGEGSPIAVFDLAEEDAWWTATGVRRVSTGVGLSQVDTARLLADAPLAGVGSQPTVAGDDWQFEVRAGSLPRPLHGEAQLRLEVIDLASLTTGRIEFARFPCTTEAGSSEGEPVRIRARGAAAYERALREADARIGEDRPDIVWALECRVGAVTVARSGGRR